MVALNAPVSGCCDVNALRFWHLRVSKAFERPAYYIGQTVLHSMKVTQGEILHPVTVIGLWWNGFEWIYVIEFPEDHPQFKAEDHEWGEVEQQFLEAM